MFKAIVQIRMFLQMINKNAKPAEQNITPGVVVDRHAVNPVYAEFYLNSHLALQVN